MGEKPNTHGDEIREVGLRACFTSIYFAYVVLPRFIPFTECIRFSFLVDPANLLSATCSPYGIVSTDVSP